MACSPRPCSLCSEPGAAWSAWAWARGAMWGARLPPRWPRPAPPHSSPTPPRPAMATWAWSPATIWCWQTARAHPSPPARAPDVGAGNIAAPLAWPGSPAFFVHPAEASHGDLGMVTGDDLVLALSNSGESAELTAILPVLRRLGTPLIALTGGLQSTLARHAELVLDCSLPREACQVKLAPTASTTAQLAMGDALAVALLDARGFRPEDFARSHPGGALGRKLLTH